MMEKEKRKKKKMGWSVCGIRAFPRSKYSTRNGSAASFICYVLIQYDIVVRITGFHTTKFEFKKMLQGAIASYPLF